MAALTVVAGRSGRMAGTAHGEEGGGVMQQQSLLRPLSPLMDPARLLAAVLATARDHYYLIDGDKRFRFASEAALRTLGLSADDLLGRTWQEAELPAHLMLEIEHHVDRVLATGESMRGEISFRAVEELRTFEYQLDPVRDEMVDEPGGVLIAARDVSEQRRSEAELREREVRFRRAVTAAAVPI